LNEPEYSYSSADYAALVKVVGEAVQKVAPDELLVGPALGFKTGTMSDDTVWLEDVFKGGILQYLSAVTLHPYLDQPESVFKLYQSVRSLITKYAPAGKTIPVLSGEWGFQTSTSGGVSEAEQADMVTRIYLTNLYNGVPISIWYDWDDGPTGSALDRYGLVGPPPAMTPKPAYTAASNLAKLLGGYSLERRVNAGNSNTDLILRFSRPGQTGAVFVGWVMQPGQTHTVTIPASEFTGLPTTVPVRGNTGNTLNALTVGSGGLSISISPSPTYFLDR
jgi:hypothetical protein